MDYKEMPQLGDLNIPYYVQIYDIIYQLIQDEKLKEGDSLPGENILAEYWNVSCSILPTHALSAAWMPLQGWRQSSASRTEDG